MLRYNDKLHTELEHRNLTDLFVAVLLSPQCTDKQVNETTKALFKRFRSFEDYAHSDPRELGRCLKGINFYKTKARHLRSASKAMVVRFGGRVPRTLKELLELDGVGRKIANVVLSEGYGINEGIAVDTHVSVTSRRLGLSRNREASATSSISVSRPRGARSRWWRILLLNPAMPEAARVLMGPAEMPLTRIPSAPRSAARKRTLDSRLALARPMTL